MGTPVHPPPPLATPSINSLTRHQLRCKECVSNLNVRKSDNSYFTMQSLSSHENFSSFSFSGLGQWTICSDNYNELYVSAEYIEAYINKQFITKHLTDKEYLIDHYIILTALSDYLEFS